MNPESESASLMEALVAAVREKRLEAADSLLPQLGWLDPEARKAVIEAAVMSNCPDVLFWAVGKGFDPVSDMEHAENSLLMGAIQGCPESVAWILEQAGDWFFEKQTLNKALCFACEKESSELLVKAGAGLPDMNHEGRMHSESRLGATGWQEPSGFHSSEAAELVRVTHEEFLRAMNPRFGVSNPEEAEEPYWTACIKQRCCLEVESSELHYAYYCLEERKPLWSSERYGQSLTFLPDGRVVEIGGEHDDGGFPDFCIYNDVFVHEPGRSVKVFLYPESVFPPTDFHSATLVGDSIFIIGCLGYRGQRRNQVVTPVYRLDLNSMAISQVVTSGEMPGWISDHRAIRTSPDEITVSGGKVIQGEALVPFEGVYTLNLETMMWRRREAGDE